MSARFRIRTSSGQEMEFASLEVFSEFVRLGDLAPDDVVYDAETKEWSSAQTHPVVLELQLEAEETGAAKSPVAEAGASSPPTASASPTEILPVVGEPLQPSLSMGEIGLDLAPAPSQLTPEQEAAAFIGKMEAERASDVDAVLEAPIQGFTMDQASLGPVVEPAPPPRRVEPRPAPIYQEPARAPAPRYESATRTEVAERPVPKRARTGPDVARYAPFAIIAVVLVAAGVYFGPELFTSAGNTTESQPPVPVVPDGSPPEISSDEEAVRRRAQERYLNATQTALRGLDPIPQIWLRGQYLAAPSDYANVRTVWDEYLTTVREVRAGDRQRYEAAYTRALDDARVASDARSARLARALAGFDAAAAARNRHYDQVEAVAAAALRGHDALVQAEGTIAYEPATGQRVSGDPVIEAVGRGPEAQALLERVLDSILAELQGPGGPGEAANVREWAWTGLLDAVTNQ